jgi:hypothetical protein
MKILIGILVGILLASGCVLTKPSPPLPTPGLTFAFTPGQGSCATGEPGVSMWSEAGVLKFAGSVTTSTPCYTLDATYKINGKVITINIQKRALGGVCIQCIGAVPFEGEITGLKEGDYRVKLLLEGKLLKEAVLTIKVH